MQQIDLLDELLANITTNVMQCNFDKAKDLCRKEKILGNSPFKDVIYIVPSIINVEKCYIDLGFLSSRSKISVKKENTLKSAYEDIKIQCEKLLSTEDVEYRRILSEILKFAQIRSRLIDFYDRLYTFAGYNKHWKMAELLATLKDLIDNEVCPYLPKTLTSIKATIEIEVFCLYDLLNAQLYLENWNLLFCTSHINSLKSRMSIWEKSLHNKETWKVNFLRSNTFPELFRWMQKFKTFILEKFSLYFYMIIRQQTSIPDLKTLCSKNNLDFLQKFQTLSKKFGHEATSVMLIFDACGIKNWSGPGYRCPLKKNTSESAGSSYNIMVRHPEKLTEPTNLMPTVKKILVDHFSDILFLDKVVCQYVPSENGTYFVASIEEKISLVSYYNCRKDDKKADIENYMLELAWMIRCHRIFSSLNSSGR
ncbi:hypothetical protein V9T40_006625 [Parthenolecanium corni]|uniref:Uncharacterized protein n=1 Tax=Parthenolecanium corni TaxID=536013 RepID=A0AAN9TR24_9HEMI